MKLVIYLTAEGAEKHAMGQKIYPWHFTVRNPEDTDFGQPPPDGTSVGSLDAVLPSVNVCRTMAETMLKNKLREVQAEAYTNVQEVENRLSNLLALPFDGAAQ